MEGPASEVEAWFDALSDHQRAEADQLADLVRAADEDLEESVKWGRLSFTIDGDWHHWICAVGATRTETKLLFHKGALLDDPAGLLAGDGRYLRHVGHEAATTHPDEVTGLVQEAIRRQPDMLDD